MAAKPSLSHGVARRGAAARAARTGVGASDVRTHRVAAVRTRGAVSGPAHVGQRHVWVDPTADSPLADENTLRLEHIVSALGARQRGVYERYVKPALDRLIAALLLILLAPVLLVTAVAIWFTLGSPVMFRQIRVGRGGREFGMLKFRTMRPDRRRWQCPNYRGPERRVTHKSANDPRHTALGRKLRKSSIDELPQLFNVLRGDMSLVGPRPELIDIVQHYRGWQHGRHAVKPGITGLWQVTERPNGGLMHECVELDLAYIERLSLRCDLSIVFKTPFALLRKDRVV
jgi:lipopolysaccharide/colanic/teichoic acid biosynthesis glycosyltransferase